MHFPHLTPEQLAARYTFLCRSTELQTTDPIQAIEAELGTLRKMLQVDLLNLSKNGSPNDFVEIYQDLTKELDRFEDFCTYPVLSTKFVVAFGGAFSAGKSSLINALLGSKLLPVEIDPTTSLATFIFKGKEDFYHALNVHKRPIALLEDEFFTLTHDESARFGSQIAGLLNAVYISRKDFKWGNLAFSDTPGYTKPDEVHSNARNDEQLARNQLNAAQSIIWVIASDNGGITDTDLKFLKTLNPAIPLFIVVTRADKKTASDIKAIIQGINSRLSQQSISVVNVVAVSNRQTFQYPLKAVLDYLEVKNKSAPTTPTFERNFLALFMRYREYLVNEKQSTNAQLSHINQILVQQQISGLDVLRQAAKTKLTQIENELLTALDKLTHEFIATLKSAYEKAGKIPVQPILPPAKQRTVWQIHKAWFRQHFVKNNVLDIPPLRNNLQVLSNVKEESSSGASAPPPPQKLPKQILHEPKPVLSKDANYSNSQNSRSNDEYRISSNIDSRRTNTNYRKLLIGGLLILAIGIIGGGGYAYQYREAEKAKAEQAAIENQRAEEKSKVLAALEKLRQENAKKEILELEAAKSNQDLQNSISSQFYENSVPLSGLALAKMLLSDNVPKEESERRIMLLSKFEKENLIAESRLNSLQAQKLLAVSGIDAMSALSVAEKIQQSVIFPSSPNVVNDVISEIEAQPKPIRGDRKSARIANDDGLRLMKENRFEEAIRAFNRAFSKDQADIEILGNLSYAYLMNGQLEEAIRISNFSLQVAPRRAGAWNQIAIAHAKRELDWLALRDFMVLYTLSGDQVKTQEYLNRIASDNKDESLASIAKLALIAIQDKITNP